METTFENYWIGKNWHGKNWLPPELISEYYDTMKHTVVIIDAEKPKPVDPEKANPVVGHLSVTGRKCQRVARPQNNIVEKSVSMLGGGVVVSPYGHILTAYHVIEGALDFGLRSTKGDKYHDAILVAGDPVTDLAIIRRQDSKSDWDGHSIPHVKFASSSTIEVGAQTISINHTRELCHTLSLGHLAYPSKTSTNESDRSTACVDRTYEWRRAGDCYGSEVELQTFEPSLKILQLSNMNAQSGASGCPVFNSAGLLIGLHVFRSKDYDFAIDIDTIKCFVQEVLEEELTKGWLTGSLAGPIVSTLTGTKREFGGEAKNLGNTKSGFAISGKKCEKRSRVKNAHHAQDCAETCARPKEGPRASNLTVTGTRREFGAKYLGNTEDGLDMPAKMCPKRRQDAHHVQECAGPASSWNKDDQWKTCDRSGKEKLELYTKAIDRSYFEKKEGALICCCQDTGLGCGSYHVKEMLDHLKSVPADHVVLVKSDGSSLKVKQGVTKGLFAEKILSSVVEKVRKVDLVLCRQIEG